MKFSIVVTATIAAFVILLRPSPASAEFAICNSSTYGKVNAAIAATWSDSAGYAHGETDGWWIIPQGECKIVITTTDISAYTLYIYAFADAKPSVQYWGGSSEYCLDPGHKFLYQGDKMHAPCPSGKLFDMRLLNTGGQSTYTYFLRD